MHLGRGKGLKRTIELEDSTWKLFLLKSNRFRGLHTSHQLFVVWNVHGAHMWCAWCTVHALIESEHI